MAKKRDEEDPKILYALYVLALAGVLCVAGLVFGNAPMEYTFLGLLLFLQIVATAMNTVYLVHTNQ